MKSLVFLTYILLISCAVLSAQQQQRRLLDIANVWSYVNYFHPGVVTKSEDFWDKVLAEKVIPSFYAGQDYLSIIQGMLAELQDPNTFAYVAQKEEEDPFSRSNYKVEELKKKNVEPSLVWTPDGIAILTVTDNKSAVSPLLADLASKIQSVAGVVVDLRYVFDPSFKDFSNFYFLLGGREGFSSASSRFRQYEGVPPLEFPNYNTLVGPGIYTSSWKTLNGMAVGAGYGYGPAPVRHNAKVSFIVADYTPKEVLQYISSFQEYYSYLYTSVLATQYDINFVHGMEYQLLELSENIKAIIRTSDFITAKNGTYGFYPSYKVTTQNPVEVSLALLRGQLAPQKNPQLKVPAVTTFRQNWYANMTQGITLGYRYVGLFRFWSQILYSYPYLDINEGGAERWANQIIPEFVSKIELATDVTNYHLTMAELAANINDCHVFVISGFYNEYFGRYVPPVTVKLIEGSTVVVASQDPNVQVGDVITHIDGVPVEIIRNALRKYVACSHEDPLQRNIHGMLLRGKQNSSFQATLRSGKVVPLVRSITAGAAPQPKPSLDIYDVLPTSNIGYIDFGRLTDDMLPAAFNKVKDTKGLILDMRGYPISSGPWDVLQGMVARSGVVAAQYYIPQISWQNAGNINYWQYMQAVLYKNSKFPYANTDNVVMLINEGSQSAAETTCMYARAALPKLKFLGSPTAGANGNILLASVPSMFQSYYTAMKVLWPDNSQLQRLGVQPDIPVRPTVAGIAAGVDELLREAEKQLTK